MAQEGLEADASVGGRAGTYEFMVAMIGACAFVAHADGSVDPKERKRVLLMMRALPVFSTFSGEAVLEEFSRHEQALVETPESARAAILEAIKALPQHHDDVRLLLAACQTVLEADGVYHPSEYNALGEIGQALGPPQELGKT